jgi:hypothetical protein
MRFLREDIFKKWKDHGYCIQAEIRNGFTFNLQTPTLCINDMGVSFFFAFFGFDVELKWSCRCDHAGPSFDLSLPFAFIHLNIYNTNHWNYEEGRWNTKADYEKEIEAMNKKKRKTK